MDLTVWSPFHCVEETDTAEEVTEEVAEAGLERGLESAEGIGMEFAQLGQAIVLLQRQGRRQQQQGKLRVGEVGAVGTSVLLRSSSLGVRTSRREGRQDKGAPDTSPCPEGLGWVRIVIGDSRTSIETSL
jgi:hypothetical protein